MDSKLLKSITKKKSEEPPNTRLQSLRLPRDLSLGGTKPRRVYVPNVNVVRNKDKAKEVIKNLDRKRKERIKNESRTRGDGQRFVQSSGIFSDGMVEQSKSTAHSEKSQYCKSENDPSVAILPPTYNKCKWMVDKQKENIVLDELLNQDDGMKEEKMALAPVMWKNVENKGVQGLVKTENLLNGDVPKHVSVENDRNVTYFRKIDQEGDNSRLALLKLPDSLAGKGLSDDPNVKKIFDYPLNVMLEGKIGTLQIKQSGKMHMKIGNVKYHLETMDFFSSREAIAALAEPSYGKDKPQLAVLGNVEQRFVLTPIWKYLLES